MMNRKVGICILGVIYLAVMAYFAFRPFRPIRGVQYAPAELEWKDGAIHLQRDAALEVIRKVEETRSALMQSSQLSLEILLRTDSLQQPGTPGIIAYSQSSFNQNFSLSQEGNGIEFRLQTVGNLYGLYPSFVVPQVLDPDAVQHLVITYDGALTRLYVDGGLRAETDQISGGFNTWGRNHALTLGDEPPGGDAWFGCLWYFSIYDRALTAEEVGLLAAGTGPRGALLSYDFTETGRIPEGMKELRYRNLFITTDAAAYALSDCIFNIIGFIPLGAIAYMILPLRMERRKIVAGILVPVIAGLAASGIIEWLQSYVFMRVPCALDLVYNTMGSLLGGLLAWLSFSTFKNKATDGSDT